MSTQHYRSYTKMIPFPSPHRSLCKKIKLSATIPICLVSWKCCALVPDGAPKHTQSLLSTTKRQTISIQYPHSPALCRILCVTFQRTFLSLTKSCLKHTTMCHAWFTYTLALHSHQRHYMKRICTILYYKTSSLCCCVLVFGTHINNPHGLELNSITFAKD